MGWGLQSTFFLPHKLLALCQNLKSSLQLLILLLKPAISEARTETVWHYAELRVFGLTKGMTESFFGIIPSLIKL